MPFDKQITIVTGGASGIGRALCAELARRGATLIIGDINLSGAQDVARTITASGGTEFAVEEPERSVSTSHL